MTEYMTLKEIAEVTDYNLNTTITEGKAVAGWLKTTLTLLEAGTLQGCFISLYVS